MKTNIKTLVIIRGLRTILFLLLLCLCFIVLVLTSQVPIVEKSISNSEKDKGIELKVINPYLKSSFLELYDLSKSEYILNDSTYEQGKIDIFGIRLTYDSLSSVGSSIATTFSKFEGGDSQDGSLGLVVVAPESDKLNFYVKNLVAENTQMVRNFFLTEIILFLLAILGREVYKLFSDIYSDKRYLNQRVFGVKTAKWHMFAYLFLSLVMSGLLYLSNRVPVNNVSSDYYVQKSSSLFSLYDISCAYQHVQVPAADRKGKDVEWRSTEIVEFVPNNVCSFKTEIGPKSVLLKDVPMNEDVDVTFYVRYLQSSNYQEIKLFVLTTLLLFFLERIFFYFRKWIRNRYKV